MDLQDFDLPAKRSVSLGSNLGHVDKDVYYWEPKSLRIRRHSFTLFAKICHICYIR